MNPQGSPSSEPSEDKAPSEGPGGASDEPAAAGSVAGDTGRLTWRQRWITAWAGWHLGRAIKLKARLLHHERRFTALLDSLEGKRSVEPTEMFGETGIE